MNKNRSRLCIALALLAMPPLALAQIPYTTALRKVSLNTQGVPLNGVIYDTCVSQTGSLVLMLTDAQNVGVGTPVPGRKDLYARNTTTGAITVVGTDVNEIVHFGGAPNIYLTSDGQFAMFQTGGQVVGHDLQTGITEYVSRTASGGPCNGTSNKPHAVSTDGRYVLFSSNATDLPGGNAGGGVYLYRLDRQTGSCTNVIVANDGTARTVDPNRYPALSASGDLVAFCSTHADLVPNDTNNAFDMFVRDMVTGLVERVSVASDETQFSGGGTSYYGCAVSSNGRFVVSASQPGDLGLGSTSGNRIYCVRDRWSGTTTPLAVSLAGVAAVVGLDFGPRLFDRTNKVVFATSTSLLSVASTNWQIYSVDLDDGSIERVSNANGVPGNSISWSPRIGQGDLGMAVAFVSSATNLTSGPFSSATDIYVTEFLCTATSNRYGHGKAGTGGIVPQFFGTSGDCSTPVSVAAAGGLGGALLIVVIGSPQFMPISYAGSEILIDLAQPHSTFWMQNGGLAGIPGAGNWFYVMPQLSNVSFAMQAFFFDPSAVGGFSSTNGLEIQAH